MPKPKAYTVTLTELTTNRSKYVDVWSSADELKTTFDISNGAVYNVSVLAKNCENAEPATIKFDAPALPVIQKLKVVPTLKRGFVVFWKQSVDYLGM